MNTSTRPTSTFLRTVTLRASLLALPLLIVSSFSQAETVEVPVGQQAQQNSAIERPRSGTKQAQVEEKFGQPISKTTAVGEPPISTWTYQNFIVYFEYDHVVHTVLKHTPVGDAAAE